MEVGVFVVFRLLGLWFWFVGLGGFDGFGANFGCLMIMFCFGLMVFEFCVCVVFCVGFWF